MADAIVSSSLWLHFTTMLPETTWVIIPVQDRSANRKSTLERGSRPAGVFVF